MWLLGVYRLYITSQFYMSCTIIISNVTIVHIFLPASTYNLNSANKLKIGRWNCYLLIKHLNNNLLIIVIRYIINFIAIATGKKLKDGIFNFYCISRISHEYISYQSSMFSSTSSNLDNYIDCKDICSDNNITKNKCILLIFWMNSRNYSKYTFTNL